MNEWWERRRRMCDGTAVVWQRLNSKVKAIGGGDEYRTVYSEQGNCEKRDVGGVGVPLKMILLSQIHPYKVK
ncbi:hypothetical protein E3N88_07968 [Mikania micrantha]|uniref:Uncharacterized protein n=1 Tax=Mikania micrantha TaxID=192012 RepID=A0A5N6PH04_9ASTR|nr:hypothetical protein E3N88_07968 [Mikania micrantha]